MTATSKTHGVCFIHTNLIRRPRPNKLRRLLFQESYWQVFIGKLDFSPNDIQSPIFEFFLFLCSFWPFKPGTTPVVKLGERWKLKTRSQRAKCGTCVPMKARRRIRPTWKKLLLCSKLFFFFFKLETAVDLLAIKKANADSPSISSWFIWRLIEHSLGTNLPLVFYTRSKLMRSDW